MSRRHILSAGQRSALLDLPTDEASLLRHYILADDDLIHIDRHLALGGLLLGQGDGHGAVKGFQRQQFDVADLDRVARLD